MNFGKLPIAFYNIIRLQRSALHLLLLIFSAKSFLTIFEHSMYAPIHKHSPQVSQTIIAKDQSRRDKFWSRLTGDQTYFYDDLEEINKFQWNFPLTVRALAVLSLRYVQLSLIVKRRKRNIKQTIYMHYFFILNFGMLPTAFRLHGK